MLELQKILLLVRFLNQISCNKGSKAKISCSFTCLSCLTPLGLESSKSRKTASFLTSHGLKKYKSLHPRSFTNGAKTWYINVEIHQFLKENCEFLSVIWVKWKQSVCSITLLYSSTFNSLFLPFFVLEIFKFKYDKVFVRNSASISKFEWFEQPAATFLILISYMRNKENILANMLIKYL